MTTAIAGQGLGRVFDIVGNALAHPFSMKHASAVTFVVVTSGAATVTLQGQTAFSGGTNTAWSTANGFGQTAYWYEQAGTDGTHAWTKKTASWSTATLTLSATTTYTSVFTVYDTQFAASYEYIDISSNANVTSAMAILHDLKVARTPANLAILGV